MTTQTKRRRSKGDGAVYQRCEVERGCPPLAAILDDNGNPVLTASRKPKMMRPDHDNCRGLYVANLDLGYQPDPNNPPYRKRKRKVVYAKTKTEALRKLRAAQAELAQYGSVPTSTQTLADWLDYWVENIAKQRLKPKTWSVYRTYISQYLKPVLGHIRLDKLEPTDVRTLHRFIERKGLSGTTALQAHRILSKALKDSVRERIINRNPASADYIDAPRKDRSTREGLTADHAKAVLRAAQDDRLASRWLFAFLTGARQGETLGLRWQHVDLENGTVDLAVSLQALPWLHGCEQDEPDHKAPFCLHRQLHAPNGYQVLQNRLALGPPKTAGSIRRVPLAPPLLAALKLRHKEQPETERAVHSLVWCREDGQPIDPAEDWASWKGLLKAASVPDVTLHESRNTCATLLHEAGVDDGTAAQILGHSNVIITRGYQRKDIAYARDAVDKLGKVLALE